MDYFKECPACHNPVLKDLDRCNFCNYVFFDKGFNMKRMLLVVLVLGSMGFGFMPSAIYTMKNAKAIKPNDSMTLQEAYDWLKSSSRDAEMGALSSTNRRTLLLTDGYYNLDYTALACDTSYVDIIALGQANLVCTAATGPLAFSSVSITCDVACQINGIQVDTRCDLYPVDKIERRNPTPSFIESFDDHTNWTLYDDGNPTKANETALVQVGTNAIKVTMESASTNTYVLISRNYGEGTEKVIAGSNYRLRYYVDPENYGDLKENGGLQVLFYETDVGGSNRKVLSLPTSPGWNVVDWSFSEMTSVGTYAITTPMRTLALRMARVANTTTAPYVVWDSFEIIPHGRDKAALIWTFDDAIKTEYTLGIRYMAAKGLKSVMYVSVDKIGDTGDTEGDYCTVTELLQAQEQGCLIAVHNKTSYTNGYTLGTMPSVAIKIWCQRIKGLMQRNGFYGGMGYFAIPGGTDYLQSKSDLDVFHNEFIHIRGTAPFYHNADLAINPTKYFGSQAQSPYYPAKWWWGYNVYPTAANYQNMIDATIANKDLIVFGHHGIGDGTYDDLSVAEFRTIIDYIKTQVDAGTLEVITYADLLSN